MNQYKNLKNDYIKMKGILERLESTSLNDEQKMIMASLKEAIVRLDRELIDEFIDFEAVCDKLPDAVYIAASDGTTLYTNDMYQQLSGISSEEVLGKSVYTINEKKSLYTNGVLPAILQNKQRYEQIGMMNRTDTKVYITGFPIFDDEGNLKYAVAHDRNIQQLENVKDQLLKLKQVQERKNQEIEYLKTNVAQNVSLKFQSNLMYQAVSTAMAVAPTDATVLITGESGTGKEVISNQIYQNSKRVGRPFLKVNCAAIPDSLMESELFGYEPGSFTGASKKGKIGIFELADNGTLLLDEIGEMSMQMQTKLLRVLQNHEITKVGGSKAIPVNVRIIAATNRNLLDSIKNNTFREDLYYRLNVVPIELPSLRERKEDIELLVNHFLEHYNKKYNKDIEIYSGALTLMREYSWPGNIRELQNIMERLVVINSTNCIDTELVSKVLGIDASTVEELESEEVQDYNLKNYVEKKEKQMISRVLVEFKSKRKAATAMGIDHSTLVRKCQRYNI